MDRDTGDDDLPGVLPPRSRFGDLCLQFERRRSGDGVRFRWGIT